MGLREEFIIPKMEGRAFKVYSGETIRIIEVEGRQVGDLCAWNLNDLREHLSMSVTRGANRSFFKFKGLWSGPPRYDLMFEITADRVDRHWGAGTGCSPLTYKKSKWYRGKDIAGHPNCQENLAKSIEPYGLTPFDVHDPFTPFMNVRIEQDGSYEIDRPISKTGDFIDLQAKMDCLVAISACPSELAPTNDFAARPLKIQIHSP